ncbi:MAG: hypothetical protein RQ714_04825 [Nitrosomonas sp.]|nr:hypothetical protein [Nitrosomonas sp.]
MKRIQKAAGRFTRYLPLRLKIRPNLYRKQSQIPVIKMLLRIELVMLVPGARRESSLSGRRNQYFWATATMAKAKNAHSKITATNQTTGFLNTQERPNSYPVFYGYPMPSVLTKPFWTVSLREHLDVSTTMIYTHVGQG